MTIDDLEAAAKRVDKAMSSSWFLPWEDTNEEYRDFCRRIAAAALNVEDVE